MPVDQPQNLVVTPSNLPGGSLRLDWENTNTDPVVFYVERSVALNGPFNELVNVPEVGTTTNTTAFYIDTVGANRTYFYRVKAVSADGLEESLYSTTASGTSGSDADYPAIVAAQVYIRECDNTLFLLEQTGQKPDQQNGYDEGEVLDTYNARLVFIDMTGSEVSFINIKPLATAGVLREFSLADFDNLVEGAYKVIYEVKDTDFNLIGQIEGYVLHSHSIDCAIFERAKKVSKKCEKEVCDDFLKVTTLYKLVLPQLLKEQNIEAANNIFEDVQRMVSCWH